MSSDFDGAESGTDRTLTAISCGKTAGAAIRRNFLASIRPRRLPSVEFELWHPCAQDSCAERCADERSDSLAW